MSEPLISVIIPSYNHENYVQTTIRSVIEQTYQNIELIMIDDGSKDTTFEKIKEMENECKKRFVRFVYQKQENQGTCTTLNRLLAQVNGKYVAWIASDDKYTPNALSDLIEVLEENPDVGLAVGRNFIMDSEGKQCYWDKEKNNVYDEESARWVSFSDSLSDVAKIDFHSPEFGTYAALLKSNHIPNGFLIRKSILDKIGPFTREAPLEDYWLMLQISKYAKMKYIDKPAFYYRWHASNTVKQKEKMQMLEKKTFEWEENYVNNLPDPKWKDLFKTVKYRRENVLNLLFLKVYKQYDLNQKLKILEIFGLKFILKRKIRTRQ
ncbi:MAG: glycosyltransferase family 2 protein [Alphaproteobacteria bacterium]